MMNIRNASRRHYHKHSLPKNRRPHTYSDISAIFDNFVSTIHVSRYRNDMFSNVEDFDDDLDQRRMTVNEYMKLVLMTPSFLSYYSFGALREMIQKNKIKYSSKITYHWQ